MYGLLIKTFENDLNMITDIEFIVKFRVGAGKFTVWKLKKKLIKIHNLKVKKIKFKSIIRKVKKFNLNSQSGKTNKIFF